LLQLRDRKVLFFPAGTYYITDTVYVPPGSRLVGQTWSTIMADGNNFNDATKPRTMLLVGKRGEKGTAQFIDLLFSARGPKPGAKLVEWNMAHPDDQPGACGMWDTHFRIGGAVGTNINPSNCPRGNGATAPPEICNGVWAMLHMTNTSSAYLENVWGWTADHDIDFSDQINVYTARGFLCESQGPVWMYGTAFEHNYLYQYSFANASNVLLSLIQTETPYYQPSSLTPFDRTDVRDPMFCDDDPRCKMSYAVYIKDSKQIYTFGTGLYSFFNSWNQDCLQGQPNCQLEMVKMLNSKQIYTHALNTYGSVFMKTRDERYSLAQDQDNTFCSTSAVDLNLF
jgi:glucan 1,3-beta-glucosidase